MKKQFVILLFCCILVAPTAAGKRALVIRVVFWDKTAAIYEFSDYDKKRMTLVIKATGEEQKIKIDRIACIQFDTSCAVQACEFNGTSGDRIGYSQISDTNLIFLNMDREKVTCVHIGIIDRRKEEIPVSGLRYICLNPAILKVDRMEYGAGFNLLSESDEVDIASVFASDVEATSDMLDDQLVDMYVDSLGKSIAGSCRRPDLQYSFKVINTDNVNAFTVGGGSIYVNRGLIAAMDSEAELAGVLAHEIGHCVGRHTSKQLSKQLLYKGIIEAGGALLNKDHNKWVASLQEAGGVATFFALMKYSRDDEREADMLAFYNLYEAGIDPGGMVTLFQTFAKLSTGSRNLLEEWISTHPDPEERREDIAGELAIIDASGFRKDSDRFQWIKEYVCALPPPNLYRPLWIDTFQLKAGAYSYVRVDYDGKVLKNATVYGSFMASGGLHNDTKLRILDNVNFINFSNGNNATDLLNTDQVTTYELDFRLPKPGLYYVVFDNTYSILDSRVVISAIYLRYNER